jgi:hypothetical protein
VASFYSFSTPVGIKRNSFASAKLFWYAAYNFALTRKNHACIALRSLDTKGVAGAIWEIRDR